MKPAPRFTMSSMRSSGRRRRDEVDVAQAGLAHERFVVVAFLRRQIEHEQTVHARLGGVVDETSPCPTRWIRLK